MKQMYAGITYIPGNKNGEWIKGDRYSSCYECGVGSLFYYWQKEYYYIKCDKCGYLYDTGRKMTSEEIKEMKRYLEDKKRKLCK